MVYVYFTVNLSQDNPLIPEMTLALELLRNFMFQQNEVKVGNVSNKIY